MTIDSTFLSAIATLALTGIGALASSEAVRDIIRRSPLAPYLFKQRTAEPFSQRLTRLTSSLAKASDEVDSVIAEMSRVATERQAAFQKLEADLLQMEGREAELRGRIADLEKIPLPVAEHFAALLRPTEKRNQTRDYLLFGGGVVATAIVDIALRVIHL